MSDATTPAILVVAAAAAAAATAAAAAKLLSSYVADFAVLPTVAQRHSQTRGLQVCWSDTSARSLGSEMPGGFRPAFSIAVRGLQLLLQF